MLSIILWLYKRGNLRGAKPLFLISFPLSLKERGIKGVR